MGTVLVFFTYGHSCFLCFFLYLKTVLFLFLSYMDIVVHGFWCTQTPYVVCCLSHTYNVAIVGGGGGCSVDVLLLVVSEELRPC